MLFEALERVSTRVVVVVVVAQPDCAHVSSVKPVLNWANVSSRTYLEVFGEASWILN